MWNKKGVPASIVYIPKLSTDDSSEKASTHLVMLKECDKSEMIALYYFWGRYGPFFLHARRNIQSKLFCTPPTTSHFFSLSSSFSGFGPAV